MGQISNYFISIIVVVMFVSVFYFALYSESTNPNKVDMSANSTAMNSIANMTNDIAGTLQTDAQADPNNPVDVAGYFGKALAVGGKILVFIITVLLASVDFVGVLLSNISSLPAPFNVIGLFITYGIAILTLVVVFLGAKTFLKWDI